ncbi:hypothetical protein JDS87_26365 [Bacillus cereus]|uniref:pyruvate kinase n=1 Tax=Bacillus cereus TaxID=1396 RepID=UPI0018F41B28|nr:pyruvate kinase [Bacillus cereus]MBJ8055367.1 hypothetical protein [Bacillus cereus]
MQKKKVDILASTGPALCNINDFIEAINLNVLNFRIHLGKKNRNHIEYMQFIKQAESITGKKVNIFIDLPSSRPRVAKINSMEFIKGEIVRIGERADDSEDYKYIKVNNFSKLLKDLKPLQRIAFRDGKIEFHIIEIDYERLEVIVECSKCNHILESFASVSFPDSNLNYDEFTINDLQILNEMKNNNIVPDWVCISFVNNKNSIVNVREKLFSIFNIGIKVISKIETKEGINNLNEIVIESDGTMVARGDMALNIPPEELPVVQKLILTLSKKYNKYSVVATQILEGFSTFGVPQRAELSDIYLAINQNVCCLMLAGESGGSKRSKECMKFLRDAINVELSTEENVLNNLC